MKLLCKTGSLKWSRLKVAGFKWSFWWFIAQLVNSCISSPEKVLNCTFSMGIESCLKTSFSAGGRVLWSCIFRKDQREPRGWVLFSLHLWIYKNDYSQPLYFSGIFVYRRNWYMAFSLILFFSKNFHAGAYKFEPCQKKVTCTMFEQSPRCVLYVQSLQIIPYCLLVSLRIRIRIYYIEISNKRLLQLPTLLQSKWTL